MTTREYKRLCRKIKASLVKQYGASILDTQLPEFKLDEALRVKNVKR